jgi:CRP/FNR family transcriptional regulator, cyclic AMP receptor protein
MKHILLIEDNLEVRENTAEILELANYSVRTAENGKIGVEMALETPPDLIICDVMMPVLDGYGVLHLVQKNDTLKNIPFIFLTAKAERGDFRKGMEQGADDYITKPFNDTELLTAVEGRLKKAEMLKKEYAATVMGLQEMLHDFGGKNAMADMAKDRDTNNYVKKQVIYSEGNHPSRLYYILEGKVKTFKMNDNGKELTVGLYNQGDFLGYTALLEGTPYRDTAEAMEATELAIIPRDEFDKLVHNNREVTRKFIQLLAKNVAEKEEQLLKLAYNSLRKRVADALLLLQHKYKKEDDEKFSIQISREDLANIAGTATESLIRTLGDFKAEKLIDIKGNQIFILTEKKLSDMLN